MKHTYNQSGMSSILFAMIFAVILSLLAVGFASLVRNDQRQTLDQSLGYQAQYAAEAAVNQIKSKIKESASPIAASPDCSMTPSYELVVNSGVRVSCVTWDNKAKSLIYDPVGTEPVAVPINVPSGFNKLVISWTATNKGYYPSAASEIPNSLTSNNYPVLRMTYLPSGSTETKQQYYVPVNGGSGTINYPNVGADANVGAANCNATQCVMTINQNPFPGGYLAIAALGQVASNVRIEALQGSVLQDMLNAQYVIDATAIAQDVTKRVQARVPYGKQTWRPGFVAAADKMCKDIKIDGNNTSSVSGATVCP